MSLTWRSNFIEICQQTVVENCRQGGAGGGVKKLRKMDGFLFEHLCKGKNSEISASTV